jgi:hypothetical protein
MKDGKEIHCPEIDVLIHNTALYVPLFRLEDFVIVSPQAVCGVIQVKRTLSSGQLQKAVTNLIDVMSHLRDCRLPSAPPVDLDKVFSAAVFFGDKVEKPKDGSISATYRNRLQVPGVPDSLRPHFAGSLSCRIYLRWGDHLDQYRGFPSWYERGDHRYNAALVAFLGYLCWQTLPMGTQPPLYFPPCYETDEVFSTSPAPLAAGAGAEGGAPAVSAPAPVLLPPAGHASPEAPTANAQPDAPPS